MNKEMARRIGKAIQCLPAMQRQGILLRDVEGFESNEVCQILALSDTNQRILLHRARTKVRQALESYLGKPDPEPLGCWPVKPYA